MKYIKNLIVGIVTLFSVGCGGGQLVNSPEDDNYEVESHYVQLAIDDGIGGGGLCSGVVVAKDRIHGTTFMTAAHCCVAGKTFTAIDPNDNKFPATIKRFDVDLDLCLMETDKRFASSPAQLAMHNPRIGDSLFSMLGSFYNPENLSPVFEHRYDGMLENRYFVHPAFIPGDSGGGVYNKEGELVGFVLAYWGPEGISASLKQVWDFLYGN